MSDRDPEVRKLAEEIAEMRKRTLYRPNYASELEGRLTAFRAKRESALQTQLHRALGELGQLRGALETLLLFDYEPACEHGVIGNDYCEDCGRIALGMEDEEEEAEERLWKIPQYAKARAALTSAPLSERAGALVGAVEGLASIIRRIDGGQKDLSVLGEMIIAARAVVTERDALRAELGKGGE